ncbi:hypothetical protein N2152v2_006778 [Parachlorella kessleri]
MFGTKLLLLSALAILASAAPHLAVTEQRRTSLKPGMDDPAVSSLQLPTAAAAANDGVCDVCTNAIQSMEEYVSDPQTVANMATFLDQQICDQLPQSMVPTCKLEVPLVVTMVINMMKQSIPPATICAAMGLCDASKAPVAPSPFTQMVKSALSQPPKPGMEGPFDCPMCKVVVQVAMERLQDPALRQQLQADISDACDTMPAESQARCHAHVAALFKALDDLMHDVDPEGVCQLALFCPRKNALLATPAALSELRASFVRLATTPRLATPTASVNTPARLEDACQSCVAIISEAAAIIQDPQTQREILAYAKQGCEVFQDYKQQCETYVELYGPLILSMALQYLQPQQLCTRMGYCKPLPPPGTTAAAGLVRAF